MGQADPAVAVATGGLAARGAVCTWQAESLRDTPAARPTQRPLGIAFALLLSDRYRVITPHATRAPEFPAGSVCSSSGSA